MPVKQISMEREYAKNPDIAPEDIQIFRDWLMMQPHLPGREITDQDLMVAYDCCRKRLVVAKKVLDLNYTFRTLYMYFKDRVVDEKLKLVLELVIIYFPTEPTVEGHQVAYVALTTDSDPKKFDFHMSIKLFMMVYDLWQYEEGTVPGLVLVVDMKNTQLAHLAKLEISAIKNLLYFVQEAMFVKLKSVHFINAPYFMDKLMMLLRPFLKNSLAEIIRTHPPGDESVKDFVPEAAIPKDEDFGKLNEDLCQRLKANTEFFKEESKKRVREALRPGGKSAAADDYGIQGSFKKLDID